MLTKAEEIVAHKYPPGSYGVFALKNIEPGTLIVVEQPFSSIDDRVNDRLHEYSINYLKRNEKSTHIEYVDDRCLRLINEIEKQLLIGNASWITFDKIKLMQPIRQWLSDNKKEPKSDSRKPFDQCEDHSTALLFRKQWQKSISE